MQACIEAGVQKDLPPRLAHPEQEKRLLTLGSAHPSCHHASLPQHCPQVFAAARGVGSRQQGPTGSSPAEVEPEGSQTPLQQPRLHPPSTHGDHWSRPAPCTKTAIPLTLLSRRYQWARRAPPGCNGVAAPGMVIMLEFRRADRRFQGASGTRLSLIVCRSGPTQGRRSRNGLSDCNRPQALSTAAVLPTPRSRSSCSRLPRMALASPKTIEVFASSKRSFLMPE